MLLRLRKGNGTRQNRDVLVCLREDGSQTYSNLGPGLSYHDLTHYAIENTLGCQNAFFGLISQGWDIETFTQKNPATGDYPKTFPETMQVETLAVLFQAAMQDGTPDTQTLAALEVGCAANGVPPLRLTAEQLAVIREHLNGLWRQWEQTSPGKWLELPFPDVSLLGSVTTSEKPKAQQA